MFRRAVLGKVRAVLGKVRAVLGKVRRAVLGKVRAVLGKGAISKGAISTGAISTGANLLRATYNRVRPQQMHLIRLRLATYALPLGVFLFLLTTVPAYYVLLPELRNRHTATINIAMNIDMTTNTVASFGIENGFPVLSSTSVAPTNATPPQVAMPQVAMPQVSLPQVSLPQVSLPQVSLPQVSLTQAFPIIISEISTSAGVSVGANGTGTGTGTDASVAVELFASVFDTGGVPSVGSPDKVMLGVLQNLALTQNHGSVRVVLLGNTTSNTLNRKNAQTAKKLRRSGVEVVTVSEATVLEQYPSNLHTNLSQCLARGVFVVAIRKGKGDTATYYVVHSKISPYMFGKNAERTVAGFKTRTQDRAGSTRLWQFVSHCGKM